MSNLRTTQKDLINDFVAELIDETAFLGESQPLPSFQGTNFGYVSGNLYAPSANMMKFPFASDDNAINVGDLKVFRAYSAGQSSAVSGYVSGGSDTPGSVASNAIEKFPFAMDNLAADIADLSLARGGAAGQSSIAFGHGYTSGGYPDESVIDKFPFAADGNATDVGDLTYSRGWVTGHSSSTDGFTSGGYFTPTPRNIIDKFPFASNNNATDVGDLTTPRYASAGQSSETRGYISGGYRFGTPYTPYQYRVDMFQFASSNFATTLGATSLTAARWFAAGQSSTVSGYTAGTNTPSPTRTAIDKFPFASYGTTASIGDLPFSKSTASGQQY
jgi:hypothetical protein